MSTFRQQAEFIYKHLILQVEERKISFIAAALDLRNVLIHNKTTLRLSPAFTEQSAQLGISPFSIEIMTETSRMEMADKLVKMKVPPSYALRLVNTINSEHLLQIGRAAEQNDRYEYKYLLRHMNRQLEAMHEYELKVLQYFMLQHKLPATRALDIVAGYSNRDLLVAVYTIDTHLPSILRISQGIIKNTNMTFATTLEQMVVTLTSNLENTMQVLQPNSYVQQINAAKLAKEDFDVLFPDSFASAQGVYDHYIAQANNVTNTDTFNIEQTSLSHLGYLGWEPEQAQVIYSSKLNVQQTRNLYHGLMSAIPTYCNTMEYLLTMMTMDEAHAEILRIVQSPSYNSFPRYKIAFEDNNYALNIKESGLDMWHINTLLSPKMLADTYKRKFGSDNRETIRSAKQKVFKTTNDWVVSEHQKNRGEYYDRVIAAAGSVLGLEQDSANSFPYRFSEAELAQVPFVMEHIMPVIFTDLTVHVMHLHNKTLDESINWIWKIATRRFKPETNPQFYNTAVNIDIEDWYLNIVTDKLRETITNAVALKDPIKSPLSDNELWQTSLKFTNDLVNLKNTLNEQRIQESINLIRETCANDTEATTLVKSLDKSQAYAIPYNLKIKVPVIKRMIKAIVTIDPNLKSYDQAEQQLLQIMAGQVGIYGERVYYEGMAHTHGLKPEHLLLLSGTEKQRLFQESIESAQEYNNQLHEKLIDLNTVVVNRSHHLYPLRNDSLLTFPQIPLNINNATTDIFRPTQYLPNPSFTENPSLISLAVGLTGATLLVAGFIGMLARPLRRFGLFNSCRRKTQGSHNVTDIAPNTASNLPFFNGPRIKYIAVPKVDPDLTKHNSFLNIL